MSQLTISNLPKNAELDRRAMSAVRGGTGTPSSPSIGSPDIKVYVPINISQVNNLAQNTNVLNNSVIGPGAYLAGLNISPQQWGVNALALPGVPAHA